MNINDDLFGGILLKAVTMLKSGELKQSHLTDFIMSEVVSADDSKPATDAKATSKMKTPAVTDVKKMYMREGKSIGKVKSNGKKLIVELTAQSLTAKQEQELMQFLDNLLTE